MTKVVHHNANFDRIMSGLAEAAEIEAGKAEPARVFAPADTGAPRPTQPEVKPNVP